ncbi:MAG TPA: hypothetical protein VNW71_01965, partial [Thermoanaerobaculia bacterium]|nr:hypothetical protein [Thermoanaerobaculia bacterium]
AGPLLAQNPLAVRYRSADTIYLNSGRASGLEVGDRLEVVRGSEVIAEIEVLFTAEHSASCRVLNERKAIQADDRVRRIGETAPAPVPPAPSPAPQPEEPRRPSVFGTPGSFQPSRTRVTGAISLETEAFSDGTESRRDFNRTAARLNVRVRDIVGTPLQLRLRMRSLNEERERRLTNSIGGIGGIPESTSRDRLYELSLIYEPEDARYGFRLGRLGAGPFVGIGYLDGGLGKVRVVGPLELGGFYGRRPNIEELGFDGSGSKYGLFARIAPESDTLELFVAGIREEGETDISREYLAVETRYDPGQRWTFFQHAELDLNTGWREEAAGSTSQLSQLSLTALGRLSERSRLVISYDRFERFLTEETRFIPTELFDDLTRQGLRVSYQTGPARGLNFSVTAGAHALDAEEEGQDSETSFSLGVGAWHPELSGLKLFVGADVLGFTNPTTDGLLVTTRVGRRFGGGHELSLGLGGTLSRQSLLVDEETSTQWARASLWLELPLDFFGQAELEALTGDEIEGQRLTLGLGYRF